MKVIANNSMLNEQSTDKQKLYKRFFNIGNEKNIKILQLNTQIKVAEILKVPFMFD